MASVISITHCSLFTAFQARLSLQLPMTEPLPLAALAASAILHIQRMVLCSIDMTLHTNSTSKQVDAANPKMQIGWNEQIPCIIDALQ